MGVHFEPSVSQLQTEVLLKDVPGGWVCGACIPSPLPGSLPAVTVPGGTTCLFRLLGIAAPESLCGFASSFYEDPFKTF